MAGRSLRRAVVSALTLRAQLAVGRDATPLDYVERWVAQDHSIAALARTISADLGYEISRGFVSFVCQRLAPDARARIADARRLARSKRKASSETPEAGGRVRRPSLPSTRHSP
jgi:hypothetical protein